MRSARYAIAALAVAIVIVLLSLTGCEELTDPSPSTRVQHPIGSKMYWIDDGLDKILRANLDGTEIEDVITGLDHPQGITVYDGKMYWTDAGSRTVHRANLDGTDIETTIAGVSLSLGGGLAAAGGRIYVASRWKILSTHLDGSKLSEFSTTAYPGALAIRHGAIYWTGPVSGTIQRASLDGSNEELLVTGLIYPHGGMAIYGGKIYWTDYDLGGGRRDVDDGGKIQRSNLDGSRVETVVSRLSRPHGLAIYNGKMYWTDWGTKTIMRANVDGSAVEYLLRGHQTLRPRQIVIVP